MKFLLPILILFTVLLFSCTRKVYLKKIDAYLNASSVEEKSKYMAENFRSYFMERNGDGENKNAALESFQEWDGPLNPDIKILNYTVHDSVWTVTFNEQNDFTKPIGYPGWKGTTTITFNSNGLICETFYVPDSSNLPYKPFLKPAVEWLQKNMHKDLDSVYKNNKLIKTEATANKWKVLLNIWKNESKTK